MLTVMKCFGHVETPEKEFTKQLDAERFIREQLRKDIDLKIKAVYRIYDGMDRVGKEFTHTDAAPPMPIEVDRASQSGSQQQGSGQRFSPSPLQTSPRPKGIMSPHWKNEDKKDEKN